MINKAVIMAGGEGVRLRPLTYVVPKPLLPLGSYTVAEHIIRQIAENGIKEIFILVSYQHEKFDICLDYGRKYGINIRVIKEKGRLGTIGGLINIKNDLDAPFLLSNGDIIAKVNIQEMYAKHKQENAMITLGVKDYSVQIPYGVLEFDINGDFTNREISQITQ